MEGHEAAESILAINDYGDVIDSAGGRVQCIPVAKYLLGAVDIGIQVRDGVCLALNLAYQSDQFLYPELHRVVPFDAIDLKPHEAGCYT